MVVKKTSDQKQAIYPLKKLSENNN